MLSIGDPFASRRRQTRPSDRIDPGPPTSPWSRLSPMHLSFQQRRTPEVRAFQRPSNPSRAKHSAKNAGKTERLCVGVQNRLAPKARPRRAVGVAPDLYVTRISRGSHTKLGINAMKLLACVLVALVVSGAALFIREVAFLGDPRGQAQGDAKAGNFRDAWERYRKLALDPSDAAGSVGGDLTAGIECLQQLGREDEVDAFRDAVISAHEKNWRLLQAAATSFIRGSRYGFLVGGKFSRGNHRGGGETVSSFERDRVRALQLMQQAVPLLKNESDHHAVGGLYLDLAAFLLDGRESGEAWRLQALTDLSKLPEFEPGGNFGRQRYGDETTGAPVDGDGNPVLYHLPARYESARSDGERWRWALAQAAESSPAQKSPAALAFADFLLTQFGVQSFESVQLR